MSSKNQHHRISCTWPYAAPAPPPEPPVPPGAKSEVAELVSAQDAAAAPVTGQLSHEDENELDDVQRNIRRIHRRSITEFSHRPPHLDKFESAASVAAADDSGSSDGRERRDSSSSYGSPVRHDRTTRAPATRVKDKARSKSPRPKSPPLTAAATTAAKVDVVDNISQKQGSGSCSGGDDSVSDIIEKKWREVSSQVMVAFASALVYMLCLEYH